MHDPAWIKLGDASELHLKMTFRVGPPSPSRAELERLFGHEEPEVRRG